VTNFTRAFSKKKGKKVKAKKESKKPDPKPEQHAQVVKPASAEAKALKELALKEKNHKKEVKAKATAEKKAFYRKLKAERKAKIPPKEAGSGAAALPGPGAKRANPLDAFIPPQAAAKAVQEKTAAEASSASGGPPYLLIGGALIAIGGAGYYFTRDDAEAPLEEVSEKVQVLLTPSEAVQATADKPAPVEAVAVVADAAQVAAPAQTAQSDAAATPVSDDRTSTQKLEDRLTTLRKMEKAFEMGNQQLKGDISIGVQREKQRIKRLLFSEKSEAGPQTDVRSMVKDAVFEYKLATEELRASVSGAVGAEAKASLLSTKDEAVAAVTKLWEEVEKAVASLTKKE
jgi:hypothetical protein